MTEPFSWRRAAAMFARYLYLYRRSPVRWMELAFWPVMDLLVWGFFSVWLERRSDDLAGAVVALLGALLFWNMLYRAQQGLTISFGEELWSRSALNLFVSPLGLHEYLGAVAAIGAFRGLLSSAIMVLVAWAMYRAELWTIGPQGVWMFLHILLFGWAIGLLTTSMILRWGHAAEALTWGIPFLVQPISAVFYPVAVMPGWLRPAAWLLPSTYVFESMREALRGAGFSWRGFLLAGALNALYLLIAAWLFVRTFHLARRKGILGRLGQE